MSVWLYDHERCGWLWQLILFDGENTYWIDEMKPSGGYSKKKLLDDHIEGSLFYIGEL